MDIEQHKAALVAQQAEFDALTDELKGKIAALEKAMEALQETNSALTAKLANYETAKGIIKAAIEDASKDETTTVAEIIAVIAQAELPEIEKRRAAIAAEIEAKKAELAAL